MSTDATLYSASISHRAQLQHRWPQVPPDYGELKAAHTTWKGISDEHQDLGFALKIWLCQGKISFLYNVITTKKSYFKLCCKYIFRTKCKDWWALETALFTYSIYSPQAPCFIVFNFWTTVGTSLLQLLLQASGTASHWKFSVLTYFSCC